MTLEDWTRIQDLFHAAMDVPEAEREPFVRRACNAEPALQAELLSLLGAGQSGVTLAQVIGEAALDVGSPGVRARIGPYEVLTEIGRGGMGIVYLAERADGEYRKQVAIKVVRLSYASEDLAARFRAERQILANLDHPNIARLLDGGTLPSGQPYLVMEYVAGETLDEFCRQRSLPLLERLPLFAEVCEAVGYAHRHGVVHRDLKPGNILVNADGRVKLLDFGTAKLMQTGQSYRTLTQERRLTPAYASPEQILSHPVGPASDIYSLGVILYELIAGRHPFETDLGTPFAMERAICEKEPPTPSRAIVDRDVGIDVRSTGAVRALKNGLDTIASTAMRKDPARRYASVADLEGELHATLARLPPARPARAFHHAANWVRPPKLNTRPGWRGSIAIIFGFLCLSTVAWEILHAPAHRTSPPIDVKVTSFNGWEKWPSFSPDGSQVAFSWDPELNGRSSIHVIMSGGGQPRRLTTPTGYDEHPAWSPDGNSIAFWRDGRDVMLIAPLGGTERKLTEASFGSLSWSPDSRSLAVVVKPPGQAFSIFQVTVASGEMRRLTSPPPNTIAGGDFYMAYAPDGKYLAFARSMGSTELFLLSLSNGALVSLGKMGEPVEGMTWTLDGKDLIYAQGPFGSAKLFRVRVSSRPNPVVVPTFVPEAVEPAIGRVGIDPHSGMRLAYVSQEQKVEIWEQTLARNGRTGRGPANPSAPHSLIASTSSESSPQFSMDGRRIAFVSFRTGYVEIWISDADGQNPKQLTFSRECDVGSPRWSPDGQRIVFDCWASGRRAIYVADVKGGSPVRWTDWGEAGRPSFSRDGHRIYFFSSRSGRNEIVKVSASAAFSGPVAVTNGGGFEAYESPDGAWLYFNRGTGLWRQPVSGGPAERILDSVRHGWWTVTSQGIYFVDLSEGIGPAVPKPVNFYSFATRRISRIAAIDGEVNLELPDFCVSPDGGRMIYGVERVSNADIHMLEPFE